MRAQLDTYVEEDLPDMDPVIAHEKTEYGWRGLTLQGEVLEVKGGSVPESIIIAHNGIPIGRRQVQDNTLFVNIDEYLDHFNKVVTLYKNNEVEKALVESDIALSIAPTLRARFNRAMILLALGQWRRGFEEYIRCEDEPPFRRPPTEQALASGLRQWRGEDLNGKRLLLLHAHGFGDTLQCLRYVARLEQMGAEVIVCVPQALHSLADQCGSASQGLVDADYFIPILHLLHYLKITPENVSGRPYLSPDTRDIDRWLLKIGGGLRRKVGVAWSIGKPSDGDYPREIRLETIVRHYGPNTEFHSMQLQGTQEAEKLGVRTHNFRDFADCAACMYLMDEIIAVDTAALHLAGATGHPKVRGLLSHWASWRWLAPWYDHVKLHRQMAPGDWESALETIGG